LIGRGIGGTDFEVNHSLSARQTWAISILVCVAAASLSFIYFDLPVAQWFAQNIGHLDALGTGFGSAVLLTLEGVTVLALIGVRLFRGRLSPFGEALALASLTSMCVYAINDGVLKLFFGVPNPASVLVDGAHHGFHLLAGSQSSSFPSGHMALAASFGGAFMTLFPRSRWPLSALLSFGAIVLVVGNWHFVSDVIAGGFVGVAAGALAGMLWQVHLN
jgi:membrane-associated phospholipid phosphatase